MTPRDIDDFANWLTDCGAEVLDPTSEWEILRVNTNTGLHVVHRNKRGAERWPEAILPIVAAYNKRQSMALAATRRSRTNSRLRQEFGALVRRDGDGCFYCGEIVAPPGTPVPTDYAATTEHLVCVTHGGPNHLSNKYLAHRKCNAAAGHLSAPEKIRLRDRMREDCTA